MNCFIARIFDTHHDPNFYTTIMGDCSAFIEEKGVYLIHWCIYILKSCKARGYCIGIAFEFQTHFIAFLTLDQVFQACLYYIYNFLFTSHLFL